jgi:hypothetical protein
MQSATYLNKHICRQNLDTMENISHTQLIKFVFESLWKLVLNNRQDDPEN